MVTHETLAEVATQQSAQELENSLIQMVEEAGAAILAIYETDFDVANKDDDSPLTQADLASHRVLVAGLNKFTPDVPVVSEESELPSYEQRSGWSYYWMIDPLDGTKEFVNRNGEFTVNVALIQGDTPVWGIVGVPVQARVFVGDAKARSASLLEKGQRTQLRGRSMSREQSSLDVVASRSHGGERLETYLDQLGGHFADVKRLPVGSSLKLCVLAEGAADFYPRLGPTSEWDIAAAQAVLVGAGGAVSKFDHSPLQYSKADILNPEFYAVADAAFNWPQLLPDVPA